MRVVASVSIQNPVGISCTMRTDIIVRDLMVESWLERALQFIKSSAQNVASYRLLYLFVFVVIVRSDVIFLVLVRKNEHHLASYFF